MKTSFQNLLSEFKKNNKQIKQDHDVATLMGSLGMSYSDYERYQKAVKMIREYEDRINL